MPPLWVIQAAVAAVWLYEGLWSKLLGRSAHQVDVVEASPLVGRNLSVLFLRVLGLFECALAVWVLSGWEPVSAAVVQTVLLVCLNTAGITWARHLIPDPPGMVIKNLAFLVLAWVAAGYPSR